ncbi:MAG: nucleotidyltransferase domain-containing protein [candidate division KSB1 bacterium]|nr:nucleotidyltransferase domain-containing protein [candidate division KSB1 bacterium]
MAVYRATARKRWQQDQQVRKERQERAWKIARQAAIVLKKQFGATRVMVFGSLARGKGFFRSSDIDLAAWGISSEDFFTAVARLQDLSPEFKIDLVTMEHCKPSLRKRILDEGKAI